MTRDELWNRLATAGLVSGPVPVGESTASPWYVSAMVGVSAWIASIFLLLFLGAALAAIVRDSVGAIVVGAILCAASAAAMRTWRHKVFAEQFAVATSLAGQALVGFGILDGHWRSPAGWLAFAAVEVALVAAAPAYVHRVLSTMIAAYAVRFVLAHAGLGVAFAPLVGGAFVLAWIVSHRGPTDDALWRPVTGGLALAALLIVPASLVEILAWHLRTQPVGGAVLAWIATFALAGVLLAAVARMLREAGAGFRERPALLAFAAAAAVALAARPMPGLVVALVVLLVAFADGRRALMGLALFGMIGALLHYYYALDATLLTKSAALLATGIVVIAAGVAVRLGLADAEARHA